MLVFSEYLTKASKQKEAMHRMIDIATFYAGGPWCINNRLAKPFISMLGETYELVTDKFKFYGENVSQCPPILAFNAKGEGFEINKNV